MATPITAGTALQRLRAAGLAPREYDGWRTHTRTAQGRPWGPVHGVMVHHFGPYSTVSGAVAYARAGSVELPGPLYPILVAPDGAVHMVGWGRCNHAGTGSGAVLQAVKAERYPLPKPGTGTDGNRHFYGLCLIHPGDRDDYPRVQLDAAATVAAALCRAHTKWSELSVIGHKEWQAGKPDPVGSMNAFRRRVRSCWSGLPPAQESAVPTPRPPTSTNERLAALERRVTALEKGAS
ncbi:N-acetylmuramoyl-L-alanine amidase [Streptomyces sp. 8K308]|uniref:peptidoglycan recognition protein family protein n=1 Tax=Streptomyces sp. 8K308 TaxID=2530388 RepID=UPI0010531880|nr:N-acetylmuramoyl-L-alanine amidase [Streptomyces sp. 8K308]TDC20606.1 N-acetylmuramoyl-L-alanine amidase [Streptomyces sp. 8K308]